MGFKKINGSNLVFDEDCEIDDEDGNGAVSMCVSGRPDHDVKGSSGSNTAPACL